MGRGLDWVTHRGPFQPLLFCDSVILCRAVGMGARKEPEAGGAELGEQLQPHACLLGAGP